MFTPEIERLIKTYFLWELAQLYMVDERTFKEMIEPVLKKMKKKDRTKFTPIQVRQIFEAIDPPNLEAYSKNEKKLQRK